MRICIKYCGGCNPLYDRVALVKQIEDSLKGRVEFVLPGAENIDLIMAVQGCRTACADLSDFQGLQIWSITKIEDAAKFVEMVTKKDIVIPLAETDCTQKVG